MFESARAPSVLVEVWMIFLSLSRQIMIKHVKATIMIEETNCDQQKLYI
jgi:hypothetical protein